MKRIRRGRKLVSENIISQTGDLDEVQCSEQRRREGFRYDMRCMDGLADVVSEDGIRDRE